MLKVEKQLSDMKPEILNMGYDWFALYTQFRLETGNFTCKLTPRYNLAGMMPRKGCNYPSKKFWTHEYKLGKKIDEFSEFVIYPSLKDFIKDYDKHVQEKYPLAYLNRGSYLTYYPHLMTYNASGDIIYPSWCSAKGYEKKLMDNYETWNRESHFELKP